jgi:hypothetical protein
VDWLAYQACLEDTLPGKPVVNDEEAIENCVQELTTATKETLSALLRSVVLVPTHFLLCLLVVRMKYA